MRLLPILAPVIALAACNGTGEAVGSSNAAIADARGGAAAGAKPFAVQPLGTFNEPWAMTFLPGTAQALITQKNGELLLWSEGARPITVTGGPRVDYGGQGGLGDVVLHPRFAQNRLVYLSWIEAGEGDTRGAVVGRGRLVTEGGAARIEGLQTIWRQQAKVAGRGHYGHRIVFAPDGHMIITNGERQKFDPAQDPAQTLGKIVRLNDDGSVPADNPWAGKGGVSAQLWSMGHRNPLGLAFAPDGRLWEHEMGPAGGDEFNLIERGSNYGYPIVSDGQHYDGRDIPDHKTRPEFNAPEVTWTPVISPSSLIFYTGSAFPAWRGSALIGGLSSEALIRVTIDGNGAREAERFAMGARIREVEQGPDGSVYLLEDGKSARLLRLTPAR